MIKGELMKLKILLVSSNPHRDLSLNEEYRAIEQAIQQTTYRNSIELIPKLATRIKDFIQALNEIRPHIVHFTGHGTADGELVFTNEHSMAHPIPVKALKNIFRVTKDNIQLVFLDACYSKIQGEAIVENIDNVIGMNTTVLETTATTFAKHFYNSFASGRTIKEAFEQAKVMVEIHHPNEIDTPELLMRAEGVANVGLKDIISVDVTSDKDTTIYTHSGKGDIVNGNKIVNNGVTIGGNNSAPIITGNNNKIG
jgi:hypothetical protein